MQQAEKVFEVTVEEVHSGDDVVLFVNLGIDNLYKRVRARLRGVDTPSAFKAKASSEAGTVRELVREVTAKGRCSAIVHSQGKGGWLITLSVMHRSEVGEVTTNVNELLVSRGYVYKAAREQEAVV